MKKIGIVGAGNIAKAHARALSTIKGAELSGVYDLHESVAQGFIKQYGGRVYASIETLADASDGLIIASLTFVTRTMPFRRLEQDSRFYAKNRWLYR